LIPAGTGLAYHDERRRRRESEQVGVEPVVEAVDSGESAPPEEEVINQ
jgi:hypothetical protein